MSQPPLHPAILRTKHFPRSITHDPLTSRYCRKETSTVTSRSGKQRILTPGSTSPASPVKRTKRPSRSSPSRRRRAAALTVTGPPEAAATPVLWATSTATRTGPLQPRSRKTSKSGTSGREDCTASTIRNAPLTSSTSSDLASSRSATSRAPTTTANRYLKSAAATRNTLPRERTPSSPGSGTLTTRSAG